MFQKASDFLLVAADKYKIRSQAQACLVCEKARQLLRKHYPDFCECWHPQKYEDHVLFIQAENASASADLFLRTHEILELFKTHSFPQIIEEIRITRPNS